MQSWILLRLAVVAACAGAAKGDCWGRLDTSAPTSSSYDKIPAKKLFESGARDTVATGTDDRVSNNACAKSSEWDWATVHDNEVCCGSYKDMTDNNIAFLFTEAPNKFDLNVGSACSLENSGNDEERACEDRLFSLNCEIQCSPNQAENWDINDLTPEDPAIYKVSERCAEGLWEACNTLFFERPCTTGPGCQAVCSKPASKDELLEWLNIKTASNSIDGGVCPNGLLLGEILAIVGASVGVVCCCVCIFVAVSKNQGGGGDGSNKVQFVSTTTTASVTTAVADTQSASPAFTPATVVVPAPAPASVGPPPVMGGVAPPSCADYACQNVAAAGCPNLMCGIHCAGCPQHPAGASALPPGMGDDYGGAGSVDRRDTLPPQFGGGDALPPQFGGAESDSGSNSEPLGDGAFGDDDAPPAYDSDA